MDIFEKCEKRSRVDEAKELGIYPYFHALESRQDTVVQMEGKRRIMLGSNNYLGLTTDPQVIEAGIHALERYGTGCSGSRFLNGTLEMHLELEAELGEFLHQEAVMTFSTGFQSNLGIISALVGLHDYVICDRENHASIYDGCKLSYGKMLRYRHNDMGDLRRKLEQVPEGCGCLVVTDGVFSMGGDIANLPEIVALAREFGARVMVDDAHGLGVIGEGGRGTASYFGLEDQVDVIMGTFSKSLASLGGFMAGKERVVDYVFRLHSPLQLRRGAGGPSAAQEAAGAGGAVDAAVGLRPQRADGTGPEPPPLHHAHHSHLYLRLSAYSGEGQGAVRCGGLCQPCAAACHAGAGVSAANQLHGQSYRIHFGRGNGLRGSCCGKGVSMKSETVVLLTGGSSGIGQCTARYLAEAGCRVYELSRRDSSQPGIIHLACDVTREEQVQAAVKTVAEREGRIDIVVNNAGFGISGAVEFTQTADAQRLLDVNFFGMVRVNRAVLPYMREAGRGRIVNLSSVAAVAPIPFQTYYSASKAAVNAYTMALANEVRPFGITVCAVQPGDIATGFTSAREKSQAGDQAYNGRIGRSVARMEHDETAGMSPASAGAFIGRVALRRSHHPLYTIGGFYRFAVLLLKLLPASAGNWLLGRLYAS